MNVNQKKEHIINIFLEAKQVNRGRLVLINVIGLVIIIAVLAGGAYYYYQSTNFIKTDEAKVSGELYTIVAPLPVN